jgi:hypothetical protein
MPAETLDHFLCYKAKKSKGEERFREEGVLLSDQFQELHGEEDRIVDLTKIEQFCDAVDKNGEGIIDGTAHLTCYKVRPSSKIKPQVISTDQFGELDVDVKRGPTQLCVPSEATRIVDATPTPTTSPFAPAAPATPTATPIPLPALEHFELYKAKRTPNTPRFDRREVDLEDPFLEFDETVKVNRVTRLGVPTDKNEEGIDNPLTHLTCYAVQAPAFEWRDVEVTNQFHPEGYGLRVRRPNMLCVPSFKLLVTDEMVAPD